VTDLWTATLTSRAGMSLIGLSEQTVEDVNAIINSAPFSKYNPTDSTGDYHGYVGVFSYEGGTKLTGLFRGVYVDPDGNAGILVGRLGGGDFSSSLYEAMGYGTAEGDMVPVQIVSGLGISPSELALNITTSDTTTDVDSFGYFLDGASYVGEINFKKKIKFRVSIDGQTWNTGLNLFAGTYSGTINDDWYRFYNYTEGSKRERGHFIGTQWSDGLIKGKQVGTWANWDDGTTAVYGGELLGEYDEATGVWEIARAHTKFLTGDYITLASTAEGQAKLQALNLPFVTIGKADLSSSGIQTFAEGTMSNVTMTGVTFFSYSTNEAPRIYASGDVSGNCTGIPQVGWAVELTGSNYTTASDLRADFTLYKWDTDNSIWGANISNGAGKVGDYLVMFEGSAAGSIDSSSTSFSSFSGTSSGVQDPVSVYKTDPVVFSSHLAGKSYGSSGSADPAFYLDEVGDFHAFMAGFSDLWTATLDNRAPITVLGKAPEDIDSDISFPQASFSKYNPTDETGNYYGYTGVVGYNKDANNDDTKLEGLIRAIYIDPSGNAGVLVGSYGGDDFNSSVYNPFDIGTAEGEVAPVQLVTGVTILPSALLANKTETSYTQESPDGWVNDFSTGELIAIEKRIVNEAALTGLTNDDRFSILEIMEAGTYESSESTSWSSQWDYTYTPEEGDVVLNRGQVVGTWSASDTDRRISGDYVNAWVNWNQAVTGVAGGKLKGTFDPYHSTWQSVTLAASITTGKFLELADPLNTEGQAKLAAMNIPCIQIGSANLSGTLSDLTVNMNNVKYFAYSTGAVPRIWATGDVNGTYSVAPDIGTTVPLSLTGTPDNVTSLSAQFKVKNWDSSKWGAEINNGTGTVGGHAIDFKGAAAGTIPETGTFTGTASGISTPSVP
jgi:hypothetical protein